MPPREPNPTPGECRFLNRAGEWCKAEAVITVDYGVTGVGACYAHVAPVLLWAMGKNDRGEQPDHTATVYPAWRYEELKSS